MESKQQIAHELTMIYMNNRYGVTISGDFHVSTGDGSGNVKQTTFQAQRKLDM